MHEKAHPLAGREVYVGPGDHKDPQGEIVEGAVYAVEDWADRVYGTDPWMAQGNPAMLYYAVRSIAADIGGAGDPNIVYGKIGPFGHILHESELGEPVEV